MNSKSKLMIGIAAVALFSTAGTAAFADDYNAGGSARHDDQAEQTRQLNQAALEQARDQNDTNSERSNNDSDDGDDDDAAVMSGDGRDASDDDDDDDDDAGADKDGDVTN